MSKRDLLIVLAALLVAGGLFAVSQLSSGSGPANVVVKIGGEEKLRKPLAVNGEYEFRQEDGGVNVVVVQSGEVYMKEANCRDELCLNMGRMKNGAKTIVCLPHQLVVTIEGGEAPTDTDDGVDVIVQ